MVARVSTHLARMFVSVNQVEWVETVEMVRIYK